MKQALVRHTEALDHFTNLDETDQVLLELLSFHYLPVNQNSLISMFNSYANGTRLKRLHGFGPLNRLDKAGLLTRNDSSVRCKSKRTPNNFKMM